jgi:putative membrane protein
MEPTPHELLRHESRLPCVRGLAWSVLGLASLILAVSGSSVLADDTAGKLGATQEKLFLQSASNGGLAEVELGKLAQQRAASQDVKSFGARMVKDHSQANKELADLAARKGVSFPKQIDRKDEELRARLSKLSGPAFDKAYMQEMTIDHEHDVAAFHQAAEASSDPDVREFAVHQLPTLTQHLDEARRIQAALGGSAETSSPTSAAKRESPGTPAR